MAKTWSSADVQQHLDQQVWLCTEASAIHEAKQPAARTRFRPATAPISLLARPHTELPGYCHRRTVARAATATATRIPIVARSGAGRRSRLEAEELRQRLEEQEKVLLSLREERLRLRDQLDARGPPLMRAAYAPAQLISPSKASSWWCAALSSSNANIAASPYSARTAAPQTGRRRGMAAERSRPAMRDMPSRAWLPKAVRRTVFTARLLDQLNSGEASSSADGTLRRWLRSLPLIGWWMGMLEQSQHQLQRLFPRRRIHANRLTRVSAHELLSSPYQRCERLAYLRDIDGVLCASHCFRDSFSLARFRANQTLQIDLSGFDGLITTSPLNLQPLNAPLFLQTVHDLIPLEYGRTRDHLPSFSRRLMATTRARRIYVSQDAEQKFNAALHAAGTTTQALTPTRVLTQCPSLQFPARPRLGGPQR